MTKKLILILFHQFLCSNALLGPVGGVVSGVTGGLSGSESSSSVASVANDDTVSRSTDNEGDGEYFAVEDLPKCGLNEYYEFCGSSCLETCKAFRYDFDTTKDCSEKCEEGCFCKPGYSRHPSTGACVLSSCCPEKEDKIYFSCDATVKYCGGMYEKYREEFNSCLESCLIDPVVCSNEVFHRGCYCEDGYKRNYKGICVPESECQAKDYGYISQTATKHEY